MYRAPRPTRPRRLIPRRPGANAGTLQANAGTLQAEDAGTLRSAAKAPGVMLLFALWIFSSFFQYRYLNLEFDVLVSINPERILFLIVVAFCGGYVFSAGKGALSGGAELCMLLFMVTCLVSWALSGSDAENVNFRWLVCILNTTGFPFTAYLIMKNVRYSRENVRFLFMALALYGLYLGGTAVFEHYEITSLIWPSYIMDFSIGIHAGRSRGPLIDSVRLGMVLIVAFACAVVLQQYSSGFRKLYLAMLALMLPAAIYFTYTRGVWVAFALTLCILVTARRRLRKSAGWIGILLVLVFLGGFANKLSTSGTLFQGRPNTVEYRYVNWRLGFEVFKDYPLFGTGYGKFAGHEQMSLYFEKYLAGEMFEHIITLEDGNHNFFVGLLAETGLVGLGLYLSILALLALRWLRIYRRLPESYSFEKDFIVMVFGLFLSFGLLCQVNDLRFGDTNHIILFTLAGLVASMERALAGQAASPAAPVKVGRGRAGTPEAV